MVSKKEKDRRLALVLKALIMIKRSPMPMGLPDGHLYARMLDEVQTIDAYQELRGVSSEPGW